MSDPAEQMSGGGIPGNGNARMTEFAALLANMMASQAGGYNVLVKVDEYKEPEQGLITPAQLIQNQITVMLELTEAIDSFIKLVEEMSDDAQAEDEENFRQKRKKQRHG